MMHCRDGNLTIDLEKSLPMILGFYEVLNDINEDNLKRLQDILEQNRYTVSIQIDNHFLFSWLQNYCEFKLHLPQSVLEWAFFTICMFRPTASSKVP